MDGLKMNDGYVIPRLGLGTFRISREDAERSVEFALRNGYTLIDTANVYLNEEAVGRGIKNSEKPRGEFFLTSKIFPNLFEDMERAVDETLQRLQVEYIDLLLLHRPYGNIKKGWQGLVEAQKKGKVRSIGVSNFSLKQIQQIVDATGVTPVLNQIELNPYCPRIKFQKELEALGILTQSWYPFGGGKNPKLLKDPVLVEIADAHHATVHQIILAYMAARDVLAIPGSRTESHIKSNLEALDIILTQGEIDRISALRKNEGAPDFGRLFYRAFSTNYFEPKK